MPSLSVFVPLDKRINLLQRFVFINLADSRSALEEGVHVEFAAPGTLTQEFEDALEPGH